MKYVLIHSDDHGHTHLTEKSWVQHAKDFTPPSPAGYEVTDTWTAGGVVMMHHPEGYRDAWHCAPSPVLGTVLSGTVRIEVSDGESCLLQPGDQFVASDLAGAGHKMEEHTLQPYDLALVILEKAPQSLIAP